MEETIGYEAFFSAEEWDAIDTGDWVVDEAVELDFDSTSPDGDTAAADHVVTIYDPPGQHRGNDHRFEIECDRCGDVGAADTKQEAHAIARLHQEFVATLVDKWRVER